MKLTQLAGVQRGFTQRTLTEADLLNGWKMGTVKQILVSRTDNMVTMEFPGLGLTGANKTHPVFITVPSGFRPAGFGNYGSIGVLMEGSTPVRVGKDFDRLSMEASGSVSGILMWRTVDSFPPPRFLERFSRRLRAWWGGRSETHQSDHSRHRLGRHHSSTQSSPHLGSTSDAQNWKLSHFPRSVSDPACERLLSNHWWGLDGVPQPHHAPAHIVGCAGSGFKNWLGGRPENQLSESSVRGLSCAVFRGRQHAKLPYSALTVGGML